MSNRILLEILQDKRVQKLIHMAVAATSCSTEDNIIELLKDKLKQKEGPSTKWQQLEIEM